VSNGVKNEYKSTATHAHDSNYAPHRAWGEDNKKCLYFPIESDTSKSGRLLLLVKGGPIRFCLSGKAGHAIKCLRGMHHLAEHSCHLEM
jgi:hypothetical protein